MADDLRGDEKSLSRGRSVGILCCVPECLSNSRRNLEVKYIFAKEPVLREKWIKHIGRENFSLTRHRACSEHFVVIYQTQETVFHQDIQTPRREVKIRRAVEYF